MNIQTNSTTVTGALCGVFWCAVFAMAVFFLSASRIWLFLTQSGRKGVEIHDNYAGAPTTPLNYKSI